MQSDKYFYDGICSFCGKKGRFQAEELRRGRDQFACPSCRATHRYRTQAAAILSHFADGTEIFLDRFIRSELFRNISILEPGIRGPFVRRFKGLPNYTQSYLFEDLPLGESRDGVICQNLERMTFDDGSFDLVVTSDVMEHVPDPRKAIAEISRVLRVGGAHIFSIPLRWPISAQSTQRARIVDGQIEHILEPNYHRSGLDEPSLTFTDFGADLLDWHAAVGMRAHYFDCHRMIDFIGCFPAVVAVKVQR
jgi:SAM-dependent methyltransferase